MTERPTYVYKLHVLYPEGSDKAGWEPPGWEPEVHGTDGEWIGFQWPRNKLYLSRTGAVKRAALLERFGAKVTIERSYPVRFGGPDPMEALQTMHRYINGELGDSEPSAADQCAVLYEILGKFGLEVL